MGSLSELNNLLEHHLNLKNLHCEEYSWRVQESKIEGKGLFANRDIKPGEIIFTDHPVLIGPRAGTKYTFHCVHCFKINNIKVCEKGCGLPVCYDCEQNFDKHQTDCELIKNLFNNGEKLEEMSSDLFRSLTPLRALLLDDTARKLIQCLACHSGKIHGFEVDLIKKHLNLNEDDEKFLKLVCSILDSNAFASVLLIDNTQIIVRGLYPLGSLLNHSCFPNTTHIFDKNHHMILKASNFIPKDTEIFTTYTSLLWGTSLRRHDQYVTKHFWCNCERCKDPKEFGAGLNGLKCMQDNCQGIIYPLDPLKNSSKWKCELCGKLVSSQKVGMMQSALGSLLKSVCITEIDQLVELITGRLYKVVPSNNHVAYELKLKAINALGYNEKYKWDDLTVAQLDFKEGICIDVLTVLEKLKPGACKMRGFLLFELYRTRLERCKKTTKSFKILKDVKEENKLLLKAAFEILENDITAPPELNDFVECSKSVLQ